MGSFPVRLCLFVRLFFRGWLAHAFNFPKDCCASRSKVLLRDANETDNASGSRDVQGFGNEALDQGYVPFVRCGLDLRRKSSDGQDIGWIGGSSEYKASGMAEADNYRSRRALKALGKVI